MHQHSPATPTPTLRPRNGDLYVVRWIRGDGTQTCHRYFRRGADASQYADRLRTFGKTVSVWATKVDWLEVDR